MSEYVISYMHNIGMLRQGSLIAKLLRRQRLRDIKCRLLFMIWRSQIRTVLGLNIGCVVLLSKPYLNQNKTYYSIH